jgi:protocatechuate 3,4-dioxygenase alpha subunit
MHLPPTASQTVGPFYGFALPFAGAAAVAPEGHPAAIAVHGHVYDGARSPVPDALLEFWQPGRDGARRGSAGSLRRDGVRFTGFGRVATGPDGHYALRTLPPAGVPYLSVIVFARGLLHHLHTRVYLGDAEDALLASLEPGRRATLTAVPEGDGVHRFDIRLQDDGVHEETVFLDFG